MIVAGTVTYKMASRVRRFYNLMPDPKFVIAMGACTIGGGPYFKWGYHVVKGVDLVVPVDVYVPGCPPRPESLLEGLMRIQDKIRGTDRIAPAGPKVGKFDDELPVPHHSRLRGGAGRLGTVDRSPENHGIKTPEELNLTRMIETLRIKNLHVTVGERAILNGVNLEIKRGETHALMGPNGSGKSTLGFAIMGHPELRGHRGDDRTGQRRRHGARRTGDGAERAGAGRHLPGVPAADGDSRREDGRLPAARDDERPPPRSQGRRRADSDARVPQGAAAPRWSSCRWTPSSPAAT